MHCIPFKILDCSSDLKDIYNLYVTLAIYFHSILLCITFCFFLFIIFYYLGSGLYHIDNITFKRKNYVLDALLYFDQKHLCHNISVIKRTDVYYLGILDTEWTHHSSSISVLTKSLPTYKISGSVTKLVISKQLILNIVMRVVCYV
jgi:hypothetical protein